MRVGQRCELRASVRRFAPSEKETICPLNVGCERHATGEQVVSTRPTAAHIRFGTARRDAAEKVFISVEHEKSGFGKCGSSALPSSCPSFGLRHCWQKICEQWP